MNTVFESRTEFGHRLRVLRKERGLSLRRLQEASGVTYSVVSSIERGDRAVGAETAERLADALGVCGEDRDQFLIQAAGTRRKDRLVGYARTLESEVLNFIPKVLSNRGMDLSTINRSSVSPTIIGDVENPLIISRLQAAYERVLDACAGKRHGEFLQMEIEGQKMLCTLLMVPTV